MTPDVSIPAKMDDFLAKITILEKIAFSRV